MEMGEQKKKSSNSTQINVLMVENKRIYKKIEIQKMYQREWTWKKSCNYKRII